MWGGKSAGGCSNNNAASHSPPSLPPLWLGRDTEANEIIVATEDGAVKVRTVRRLPPSQHWQVGPLKELQALPWKPKAREEPTTDFVLPKSLTVTGKIKDPPGLEKSSVATPEVPQEPHGEAIAEELPALEDLPTRVAETSIGETERSPTVRRSAEEEIGRPAKSLRIDPRRTFRSSAEQIAEDCLRGSFCHELDLRTGWCS